MFKGNVLVVDDEYNTCIALVAILKLNGYESAYALNGEDALVLFMSDPDKFGFVITDFNMPGMNGLELGRKIRAVSSAFVLLCSASIEDIRQKYPGCEDVNAMTGKPTDYEQMLGSIGKVFH